MLESRVGGTWANFCRVSAAGLPAPSILWPIIDPILVTFGQICNFRYPNSVTFYFYWIDPFFRLNEENLTFHLHYKHCGTFANRKYDEQSYPPKSENVWSHSSNSIENATPL